MKTYSDYENAYTTDDAGRLYDKTIAHYNKSKIGFGVGGGLVVFGILYSIFDKPNLAQKQNYSFKLINDYNTFGITFQICLNKQNRNKNVKK